MRERDSSYLGLIHRMSIQNRKAVESSEVCGCFCCITEFPSVDVNEWTDDDQTAICPACDIDSVLPGCIVTINEKLLEQMCERWFCTVVDPETAKEIDVSVLGHQSKEE